MDVVAFKDLLFENAQAQDVREVHSEGIPDEEAPQEEQAPEITQEQLLQIQINQSQKQFVLSEVIDKLNELSYKLQIIIDIVGSDNKVNSKDVLQKLSEYDKIINILKKVGLNLDLLTLYQLVGTIEIELTHIIKKIHDKED
jgi:Zn-dependent oligopeptidase